MALDGNHVANSGDHVGDHDLIDTALKRLTTSGLYMPNSWGQFWQPARAAAGAGTGKAKIAIAGDSVGRGYFSSNLNTKSWAALVKTALQTAYGNGGTGYVGVQDTSVGMTGLGIGSTAQTAYASQQPGLTGSWSYNSGFGIGNIALSSNTANSTLTFTVTGTTVTVYTIFYSGNGTLGVKIDGVTQSSIVTGSGFTGVQATAYTGLSAGSHTVVLTAPGTNAVFICGVSGENATGVVVNQFSTFGTTGAAWNNSDSWGGVGNWSGGKNYPADLVIYALHLNDASAGTSGETWARNVHAYLQGVVSVPSPASDIMILLNHNGTYDNSTTQHQEYALRARGLAEAYGAALLDIWQLGRNSWAYWNNLGYWSVEDGSGGAGSSVVHPSDAGFQAIANAIIPILEY